MTFRLGQVLSALPADRRSAFIPPALDSPFPILGDPHSSSAPSLASGHGNACSQLQAIKLSNIVRLISADGMSLIPARVEGKKGREARKGGNIWRSIAALRVKYLSLSRPGQEKMVQPKRDH